jgi:hypothetical protein
MTQRGDPEMTQEVPRDETGVSPGDNAGGRLEMTQRGDPEMTQEVPRDETGCQPGMTRRGGAFPLVANTL